MSGITYAAEQLAARAYGEKSYLTEVDGKFECATIPNMHTCALAFEGEFQKSHADLMRRENGHLEIKLENGSFFEIEDPDEFNQVLELQAGGRFAVVREQFAEGNTWSVLDRKNGRRVRVGGYPLFSPDMTKFVSVSTDMQAGFSPTVFDVYAVMPDGIVKQFEGMNYPNGVAMWGGRNVRWTGNSQISFNQVTFDAAKAQINGSGPGDQDIFYVRRATVDLTEGKWQLHIDDRVIAHDANVIW